MLINNTDSDSGKFIDIGRYNFYYISVTPLQINFSVRDQVDCEHSLYCLMIYESTCVIIRVCERTVWTCCPQLYDLHMHYLLQAFSQIFERKRDCSQSGVQGWINTTINHLHVQSTTPAKLYELALAFKQQLK